jgi:hypothetical protein
MKSPREDKPLRIKAYGTIAHLSTSKLGPGDHTITEGQERIATSTVRDRHDRIIVQEKLDGSNTSVAHLPDGEIVALTRSGVRATKTRYPTHHAFASWVRRREAIFREVLQPGERLVGEWLAMAHGTRYDLRGRSPWPVFDLFTAKNKRIVWDELVARTGPYRDQITLVPVLVTSAYDPETMPKSGFTKLIGVPLDRALAELGEYGRYGAIDPVEGVVYRIERLGTVDTLVKHVRSDFQTGRYMPSETGGDPVWLYGPWYDTPRVPEF